MGCGLWKSELGSVVKNQEPITKNHQPKLLLLCHRIQFNLSHPLQAYEKGISACQWQPVLVRKKVRLYLSFI